MQPQDGRSDAPDDDAEDETPARLIFDLDEVAVVPTGARPPKRYRVESPDPRRRSAGSGGRSSTATAPSSSERSGPSRSSSARRLTTSGPLGVFGGDTAELNRRLAAGAFAIYLLIAAFVLVRFGDGLWFSSDDWGFLDGRSLGSFTDIMKAQNGHWVALPVVVFQILLRFFGLDSYLPFLLATITLHLTLCLLIRIVMRRAGVGPWLASIIAGTFVLFGAGFENMLYALQITLVGSMVFGFSQLLLADHDGPPDWRDAAALVCGLMGLMCSSVGVAMVAVVGLAVLIRRGWRMALLQTVPLGLTFAAWYGWQLSAGALAGSGEVTFSPPVLGSWLWTLESTTFTSIGGSGFVAAAIAAMLLVGGGLALARLGWAGSRRTLAIPSALLAGSLVLVVYIGTQRATLVDLFVGIASAPRYQAMVAAMVLPAIAVAGAELTRRWRVAAPIVVALLVIGIPANIRQFDSPALSETKLSSERQKLFLVAVATSPLAGEVPADVHPNPDEFGPANVTVGFLRQAAEDGRLPDTEPPGPIVEELVNVRLRIAQSLAEEPVPDSTCSESASTVVDAEKGERFVLGSPVRIAIARPDGTFRAPMPFSPMFAGSTLTSQFDQTFQVTPVKGATSATWCTVP